MVACCILPGWVEQQLRQGREAGARDNHRWAYRGCPADHGHPMAHFHARDHLGRCFHPLSLLSTCTTPTDLLATCDPSHKARHISVVRRLAVPAVGHNAKLQAGRGVEVCVLLQRLALCMTVRGPWQLGCLAACHAPCCCRCQHPLPACLVKGRTHSAAAAGPRCPPSRYQSGSGEGCRPLQTIPRCLAAAASTAGGGQWHGRMAG